MGIKIVTGYDAMHINVGTLPRGQVAGYTTGSPDVKWTESDWASHPGAVRICQDAGATDRTADVLDVETGAATAPECPGWATEARDNFEKDVRVGQRKPLIYTFAANVTTVVNALIAGGVDEGVGLWVAHWDITRAEAVAAVVDASGPFPIEGFQYLSGSTYDTDIFDKDWLENVVPSGGHVGKGKVQRHVANGRTSFLDACQNDDRVTEEALWLTAKHAPNGYGPAQRSYFGHGDLSRHMPIGMIYYRRAN